MQTNIPHAANGKRGNPLRKGLVMCAFRIPRDLKQRLLIRAIESDLHVQELVRIALESYLGK